MNKYGYAYFDSDGKLKEFIIDESVRQGNSGLNKIRIYWENPPVSFTTLGLTYINTDDLNPEWQIYPTPVNNGTTTDFYVEPVQDYDPVFFKYGKEYTGYEIALPDVVLALTGNIALSLIAYDGNSEQVAYLGIITIYISDTGYTFQRDINQSQFYFLIDKLNDYYVFDDYPIENSDNVVKSGGIYNAINSIKRYRHDVQIYFSTELGTHEGRIYFNWIDNFEHFYSFDDTDYISGIIGQLKEKGFDINHPLSVTGYFDNNNICAIYVDDYNILWLVHSEGFISLENYDSDSEATGLDTVC